MEISQNFTPYTSFIGGIIIGVATSLFLLLNGRITGISGIVKQSLSLQFKENAWRILFILGLVIGGYLVTFLLLETNVVNQQSAETYNLSFGKTVIAGLLVGVGTALGSGCTSGHGICGLSRKSKRSITATLSFMAAGFIVVYLMKGI